MAAPGTEARGNRLRRRLDHLAGSPLLYALGRARGPRPLPDPIRSIGLLSCATIGDTIIASAIARDLRAALPAARLITFVSPAGRGLSTLLEGFGEEIVVPVTRPAEALRVLRANPTDVLIDLAPWPRITAVLTALSGARYGIGFRTPGAHRHYAFDATANHTWHVHEIDNFRSLLAPLGLYGTARPAIRAELRPPADPAARRCVAFHPWASGFRSEMREWALANWVELGERLIANDYDIAITGGPADRVRAEKLAAQIDAPRRVAVLAGHATLRQTVECLARAAAAVSVNTGTMHLAAALDCPMVALHGPTNPKRWGPLSDAARVVGPGPERGGAYLHLGFEYPPDAADCMALIGVDEVWGQLLECLAEPVPAMPQNAVL